MNDGESVSGGDSEQNPSHSGDALDEFEDAGEYYIWDNDRKVSDGRVRLSKSTREKYGIEGGDHLDLRIEHENATVTMDDKRIQSQGRVSIGSNTRDRYDIEDGDYVDILIPESELEGEPNGE